MKNVIFGARLSLHLLYIFVGLLFVLPLWWAMTSSLRPLEEIFKYTSPFKPESPLARSSLWNIYLPLSKPVIISAGLVIFLFQWESFLWPLICTRSEHLKVIQVALAGFQQRYTTQWNELFAASNVATLIPLFILLPLQRFYIQGVTAAGFKG